MRQHARDGDFKLGQMKYFKPGLGVNAAFFRIAAGYNANHMPAL